MNRKSVLNFASLTPVTQKTKIYFFSFKKGSIFLLILPASEYVLKDTNYKEIIIKEAIRI